MRGGPIIERDLGTAIRKEKERGGKKERRKEKIRNRKAKEKK